VSTRRASPIEHGPIAQGANFANPSNLLRRAVNSGAAAPAALKQTAYVHDGLRRPNASRANFVEVTGWLSRKFWLAPSSSMKLGFHGNLRLYPTIGLATVLLADRSEVCASAHRCPQRRTRRRPRPVPTRPALEMSGSLFGDAVALGDGAVEHRNLRDSRGETYASSPRQAWRQFPAASAIRRARMAKSTKKASTKKKATTRSATPKTAGKKNVGAKKTASASATVRRAAAPKHAAGVKSSTIAKTTAARATTKKSQSRTAKAAKPPNGSAEKPTLLSGGNPQIAKADGDAPVQAYIAAMPDWKRPIGVTLDRLISQAVPDVRKAVKWNSPFYGVDGQGWFASFHCFTKYVKVTFFKGASLRPLPPGESKDPQRIEGPSRALPRHPSNGPVRRKAGGRMDQASIPATRLVSLTSALRLAQGRRQPNPNRPTTELDPSGSW